MFLKVRYLITVDLLRYPKCLPAVPSIFYLDVILTGVLRFAAAVLVLNEGREAVEVLLAEGES